jgi:hypothetical protein
MLRRRQIRYSVHIRVDYVNGTQTAGPQSFVFRDVDSLTV